MSNTPPIVRFMNRWPNTESFAADINVPARRAYSWRLRGIMDGRYFIPIRDAAVTRGYEGITLEALCKQAEETARWRAHQRGAQGIAHEFRAAQPPEEATKAEEEANAA